MARKRGRRVARGGYKLTAKRRVALRKAQLASARKRKGYGKVRAHVSRNRKRYIAGGVVSGVAIASLAGRHKLSGSKIGGFKTTNVSVTDEFLRTKNPAKLVSGVQVNRSSRHLDIQVRLPKGQRGVLAYNHKPVDVAKARQIVSGVKQSDLLKPIREKRQLKQAAERKANWQRDLAAIKLKERAEAKREYRKKQRRIAAVKKRKTEAAEETKSMLQVMEMA